MFSTLYGGGAKFSSGEDSKFLVDCMRRGMKVYSYEYNIGKNINDQSSWFKGFNEKYFYDKGVLFKNLFPRTAWILCRYMAYREKGNSAVGSTAALKLMREGRKGFETLRTYEEWKKE